MAAVLACGPGAVLSHASGAALLGLREDADGRQVDVTAPNRRGRSPTGIASHRSGCLTPGDKTVVSGIPCTTVVRTLVDLAAVVHVAELRRAVANAEVQRVLDLGAMHETLKRCRGRRGVARLRLLIDDLDPDLKRTRSELERRFLALCRRARLPRPEVNVTLDLGDVSYKPDFLWRDARLILEADSRRFHDTNSAFDSDRRREQRLMLAGWRVCRCTWAQVEREPQPLIETVRGLLRNPRPMGR